jgi:hypothetical protein
MTRSEVRVPHRPPVKIRMSEDQKIDKLVEEAKKIAAGDYSAAELTARNHATLQSLQISVNGELIKTIRHLDRKNSVLQRFIAVLSIIATIATFVALFK